MVIAIALGQGACLRLEVPEDIYADPTSYDAPEGGPAGDGSVEADAEPGVDAPWFPEAGVASDGGEGGDAALPPPNPSCDFSGHWMIAERLVSTGLGIQQAAQWWIYYDVEQSGDALRVRKGLVCGTASQREGPLGVDVDMKAAWPAMEANNDLAGTTGSVRADGGECELHWGRSFRVFGATMPFYADPAEPLPRLDEPADGSSPGWEDWDGDGEPGVSVHLSGALSGTRYMTSRLWASYTGRVEQGSTSFRIPMDWKQEDTILGVTSDVLKAAGTKDADPSLHFAYFERLPEDRADGTDGEICAALRELVPYLSADGS